MQFSTGNQRTSQSDAYDELCAYTLTRGDASFIHQHVLDAFAAQNATDASKPIATTFALVGLYLHVEKGFSGRHVQRVHTLLARRKREWPRFGLPTDRGAMTVLDVMKFPEGVDRDRAIHDWCVAVWTAFAGNSEQVISLLKENGIGF